MSSRFGNVKTWIFVLVNGLSIDDSHLKCQLFVPKNSQLLKLYKTVDIEYPQLLSVCDIRRIRIGYYYATRTLSGKLRWKIYSSHGFLLLVLSPLTRN